MVKVALFLTKETNANISIVEAGAWLHDFPLSSGSDYNYDYNNQVTTSVLNKFDLTENERILIAEAAASHEGTSDIISIEAKVIHDADVLEKTGILGIIRHTWKLVHSDDVNKNLSDEILAAKVLEHLLWRTKRIQTPLAKDISQYLTNGIPMDLEYTKLLVASIRPLAEQDLITEEIAAKIQPSLTKEAQLKLQEQLSLSYLDSF